MSTSIRISYWVHHTPPCLLHSLDIQRASPLEQWVPLNDSVLSTWVDGSLQELLMRSDGLNADIATSVNYGVASFLNWSLSICNCGIYITRIRRPLMIVVSFRRWTSWIGVDKLAHTYLIQGQGPRFPNGLVENIQFTQIFPLWLGGLLVVGCIGNQKLRRWPIWV